LTTGTLEPPPGRPERSGPAVSESLLPEIHGDSTRISAAAQWGEAGIPILKSAHLLYTPTPSVFIELRPSCRQGIQQGGKK
jgi:hypothetical protein